MLAATTTVFSSTKLRLIHTQMCNSSMTCFMTLYDAISCRFFFLSYSSIIVALSENRYYQQEPAIIENNLSNKFIYLKYSVYTIKIQ